MKKIFHIIFLFVSANAVAQYNAGDFSRKFNDYYSIWQKKKLHLIFNQDKVSPGDTVYFKAYFLSEDLSGVPGHQVIELHVVNASGNSILQSKFAVTNGIGKNQIVIPPTVTQGFYVVTAFSSWMLNFEPSFFFTKTITVVERNALSIQKKQELRAAVEGNRLTNGLTSRVVVSTDPSSVVQIIDASGVTVGHTLTDTTGIGSINFFPRENHSYFAQRIGDVKKLPLPLVEKEGLAVVTSRDKDGSTKFFVTSTPGLWNKELIAITTARDKIVYSYGFTVNSSGSEFSIPPASLPEGVAHLSILDAGGRLFFSRDFCNPVSNQIRANIKIGKKNIRARDRVKLEVSVVDEKGLPLESEFSIKAIANDLLKQPIQNSLADELFIQSYLREHYVVNRTDLNWLSKLDAHLVLNTEDIPWSNILSSRPMAPFHRFSNFIQMKGRVSLIDTGARKLPDFLDIMFYFQQSKIRYQSTVDHGQVWLAVPELYGQDELFYLAETFYYVNDQQHGEEIPGLRIDWEKSTPKLQAAPPYRHEDLLDPYASFATKNKLIRQSYGFYSTKAAPPLKAVSSNDLISADVNINVQEYTVFPTMADLIKEIVPFLQHRRIGHRDRVLVALNEDLALQSTGDPLYTIDGIATKNTNFFLSLKPSDVLNVKVAINSQNLKRFGLMGKNGIVIVNTKKGGFREPIDSSKVIQGLSMPLDFKAHTYDERSLNSSPDFRSTVLWNPSIETNKDGKVDIEFSASDHLGGLRVRVEGLTSQGMPFSEEVQLQVTNDKKK